MKLRLEMKSTRLAHSVNIEPGQIFAAQTKTTYVHVSSFDVNRRSSGAKEVH